MCQLWMQRLRIERLKLYTWDCMGGVGILRRLARHIWIQNEKIATETSDGVDGPKTGPEEVHFLHVANYHTVVALY